MKSRLIIIPLFIGATLCSCSNSSYLTKKNFFSFQTIFEVNAYNTLESKLFKIEAFIDKYSKLFDPFNSYKDINNVYTINNTNEEVILDKKLYDALKVANNFYKETNYYFNPYLGELTFKYKEVLENYKVNNVLTLPTNEFINNSLNNLKTFELIFNDSTLSVKRVGNCLIDLGAFAKGYVLDLVKEQFKQLEINHYFINAGNSSSYFTTKDNESSYKVGIKYLKDKYLEIKNASLGISSVFEQLVEVNNIKYSHIVNPFNGSNVVNYDFSVIKHESCLITDIFSTVLMITNNKEEIDKFKNKYNFSYLLYKDNKKVYSSNDIILFNK